jgi:hypothetical protein
MLNVVAPTQGPVGGISSLVPFLAYDLGSFSVPFKATLSVEFETAIKIEVTPCLPATAATLYHFLRYSTILPLETEPQIKYKVKTDRLNHRHYT